jgi:MFS transporter, DHA2 family, multidrug resistance protein
MRSILAAIRARLGIEPPSPSPAPKRKRGVTEPPPPEPAETDRPPTALVVAVVLTAVLEVLDITIVNVTIAHMLGSFGATPDQITWVLTSYLVSAAIIMPLTGHLTEWLGRRRLLLLSISGFVIASALCGMAWDLQSMVVFRLAQGVCGAPLVPLSQAILLDAFPKEKRGQALAIFGLGIMVAPVLGPTLGGWLTDTFTWRMVFYINVPIGLFALLLAVGHLPRSPVREIKTDWTGLVLLVLTVGALQLFLDQGPTLDWFDSRMIQICTIVTLFAGTAFFLRGWDKPDNIIHMSLLRDRNFVAGTLSITAYSATLFGSIALLPLFTQRLLGYPATTAGMLFMPRAAASAVAMALTGGLLIRMLDPRHLVLAGVILSGIGTVLMARFSLYVDAWGLIWPGIIAGVGMGLFFVPLTAIAFDSVPKVRLEEAAGLYALMRGIGSSFGIAITSWLFVDQAQIHWEGLGQHITPYSPAVDDWLGPLGLRPDSPEAIPALAMEVARQAQMQAFVDLFWFLGWVTFAIIPLVFLMKKPAPGAMPVPVK